MGKTLQNVNKGLLSCLVLMVFSPIGGFSFPNSPRRRHWKDIGERELEDVQCSEGLVFNQDCKKCLRPVPKRHLLPTSLNPTSDHSDWMKNFKSRTLKSLVLPGSHHAGINIKPGDNIGDSWDIPQVMSIKKQLKAGIRFMGFRISTGQTHSSTYPPRLTHNYLYRSLENVVSDIAAFLKEHATETVVLRLEQKTSPALIFGLTVHYTVDWKLVDDILRKFKDSIYTGSQNPLDQNIKSLGGKMIICQNSPHSEYRRLQCLGSYHVTNTNQPKLLDSKMAAWVSDLPVLSNQGFYFLEAMCSPTPTQVRKALLFDYCDFNGDQAIYVFRNLKDMAKECNYYVLQYLKKVKDLRSKVTAVMTDFVNNNIIQKIINLN